MFPLVLGSTLHYADSGHMLICVEHCYVLVYHDKLA